MARKTRPRVGGGGGILASVVFWAYKTYSIPAVEETETCLQHKKGVGQKMLSVHYDYNGLVRMPSLRH